MENLVKLLNTLKDFSDKRFYILVFILFFGWIIYTFQDTIKETKFQPQKLQEVSNQTGLISNLETIKTQHPLIVGYAFYMYQPKADAYYKSLISTDVPYIKDNRFFQSIPLNTQKYLNYRLVEKEYVLMEYTNVEEKVYTDTYAADYVFVYNVKVKETIAEVILTYNVKPTPEEIDVILRKLRTLKYFVI